MGGVWPNSSRRGSCFFLMELEVPSRGEALGRGATGGGAPFPGLGDTVCGGIENAHWLCLGEGQVDP